MDNKTFYIQTFGCKLNFAESSYLAEKFKKAGYSKAKSLSEADIIVIHSCAVTSGAEKKTRQLLHRAKRENSKAKLALIGCYASIDDEYINTNNGIDYILDNESKMLLVDIIVGIEKNFLAEKDFHTAYSLNTRTRSFLKIQDGCDYFCSYCTVAFARKRSRSNSIAGVVEDMKNITSKGFKEIIFTGVNIGTFGQKNGESFSELLKVVDAEFPNIRIRLGSVEPDLLTDEIIELVAGSKSLMPHFHIPLQSGCDNVLKQMRRRYDTKLFVHKCELIKKLMPYACIAADVIAGYPTESAADFDESYKLIENLPLSYLHVFGYSDRPLAAASKLSTKVPPITIKERVDKLINLGQNKRNVFFNENIGSLRSVLFESKQSKGLIFGFTDNYIKCGINAENVVGNSIKIVKLDNISSDNESVIVSI